jgi:hypothetical protein
LLLKELQFLQENLNWLCFRSFYSNKDQGQGKLTFRVTVKDIYECKSSMQVYINAKWHF